MRRALTPWLLALPLLGGCAMSFDATRTNIPVTMASSLDAPAAAGDSFHVRSSAVYAFWGIVPLRKPSLSRALETQLVGAKEVRDLRISVKSRWPQVLLSVLTLGLIVPRTVEYQGVIPGQATGTAAPAPAPR